MDSLKGKVALITGASSGVGRGTAVYFARLGCKLALNGRDEARLQQTKEQCIAAGLLDENVACIAADILQEDNRQLLVDTAIKTFGRLDVLVNSAGIIKLKSITMLSEDEFIQITKMNVIAPFRLVNIALPHLKKTKGNVVNVSSIVSEEPDPLVGGYCMSKASLDNCTKNLALELAEHGVRVNSVNPGYVQTEFISHNTDFTDEQIKQVTSTISIYNMDSLKGKVALITGASSGVGRGTAVYFASLGCKLALSGRDEARLQKTKEQCIEAGLLDVDVACIAADILQEDNRQLLVETTIKTFGKIDVLVNSAGIVILKSITMLSEDEFIHITKMNVIAPFRLVNLALPHLKKTKGNVVNVSSIISEEPEPWVGGYCMSKAALDNCTKNLALELAEHGVRVNSVNPGYIQTEFISHNSDYTEEQIKQVEDDLIKKHPLLRNATAEDVAKSIAVLASDLSAYVTGQIMYPAGGRNCR